MHSTLAISSAGLLILAAKNTLLFTTLRNYILKIGFIQQFYRQALVGYLTCRAAKQRKWEIVPGLRRGQELVRLRISFPGVTAR